MGRSIDGQTKFEEGQKLAALLVKAGVTNFAAFAERAAISGGKSMLHQHLNGIRPISFEAGLAYASALNCSLADFSPRLALIAQAAAASNQPIESPPPATLRGSIKRVSLQSALDELRAEADESIIDHATERRLIQEIKLKTEWLRALKRR